MAIRQRPRRSVESPQPAPDDTSHSAGAPVRLTLVIPAYNEEAYLGDCLQSVVAHRGDAIAEVIVIDNGSTDRTAEIAAGFPGVRVVREARRGLTQARQRGLEEAHTDLVGYMDADTRMPAGWAEAALRVFSQRPDVVALSGPPDYWDGTALQRAVLAVSWRLVVPLTYRIVGYVLYGAHFVVRREALLAAGGFNTGIAFYGEDTELARRLAAQGKVIFSGRFRAQTSARRFAGEGLVRTSGRYALNFLWPVLFGRPFSRRHRDIRGGGQ
jgi:glycosyltransferase involved in cell wall biosynthesis